MSAPAFIDTNILLYSISTAVPEKSKRDTAVQLLEDRNLCLSVQVLQEFYVQATRASRGEPLSHETASGLIEAWGRFFVQDITAILMFQALSCKKRYMISYWDAAVVEAARICGCDRLYSEDLQAGQDFGGVKVINPFI